MIGRKVRIKTSIFEGEVLIVDKIMTNMAEFTKTPIINNSSFEVYVGLFTELENLDLECPLIQFVVKDIRQII